MRQFKFVGGPKRKRRRRDELSGELTEVLPTETAAAATTAAAQSSRRPAAGSSTKNQQQQQPSATISKDQGEPATTEASSGLDLTATTSDDVLSSVNEAASSSAEEGEVNKPLDRPVGGFFDPIFGALPSFEDPFDMVDYPTVPGPNEFNAIFGLEGIEHQQFATGGVDLNKDFPGNVPRPEAEMHSELPPPSLSMLANDYTVDQLLLRYDQEFCVLPLTHDFKANPFRCRMENVHGSQMLLHCILALCYKHIHRDTGTCFAEAQSHERAALQMLDRIERSGQTLTTTGTLDPLLILMTLKCATSALGPWVWYLKRVNNILSAAQSLDLRQNPRMQAQIEMFAWWDVTLALTSRQGYVLSQSTIQNLIDQKDMSKTSFYGVAGCPKFLFENMVRLGVYAREFELVASMTCVRVDLGPILAIEKDIIGWEPVKGAITSELVVPGEEAETLESAQVEEDLRHCAEAWKFGLLVYIERVFKWDRKEEISPMVQFLARKTLDHVRCCRRESMTQKQLLLPMFLAGCEVKDEWLRKEASDYCDWWGKKTRYDMFLTASALLQTVWDDEEAFKWWGPVIDQHGYLGSDGTMGRQYLFG
ncbi:hypothetical protein PFICI_09758 [Pestalotiopsis fici W106-1]|uniref:Transcription factor domain-containing protein n=1 Tax=Pestalotiopsis fici (strain W106-1 / CGMCC3.15140) TaxID=1229662 RepID=W3WXT5_PESFW|nr:uncharacterized protein PFICI_09758 [Pestalotiopsis fici W106-1]ETS77696.1 hypothetical protein PFICI_09758 [Pestalotiopsis fici W106-1]